MFQNSKSRKMRNKRKRKKLKTNFTRRCIFSIATVLNENPKIRSLKSKQTSMRQGKRKREEQKIFFSEIPEVIIEEKEDYLTYAEDFET